MMKRKYSTSLGVVRTAVLAAAVSIGAALIPGNIHAQTSAVTSAPLLQSGSLAYDGAFRVPQGTSFAYGGGQLAFNPGGGLFVGGFPGALVAEVSIPRPVNSTNVANLPMATLLQPFVDPTEGKLTAQLPSGGNNLGGLLVHGGRLIGTGYIYYDALDSQRLSHYTRPIRLSDVGHVGGFYNVGNMGYKTGAVSGPMCDVPVGWQSLLGGPVITENFDIPIVSRSSYGPAAFAFDPANLGVVDPVPATGLIYYPTDGSFNGHLYNQTSLIWNIAQSQGGCVFPVGSRSLLFFSVHGIGEYCYGQGTNVSSLHKTLVPGYTDVIYCYDPENVLAKGTHAYPWVYQVLAYDANDLAAVKAGTKQPSSLVPYARWELSLPTSAWKHAFQAGGVAYDPATQRIFLAQGLADGVGEPLIHVFHIGGPGGPAAPSNLRIVRGN